MTSWRHTESVSIRDFFVSYRLIACAFRRKKKNRLFIFYSTFASVRCSSNGEHTQLNMPCLRICDEAFFTTCLLWSSVMTTCLKSLFPDQIKGSRQLFFGQMETICDYYVPVLCPRTAQHVAQKQTIGVHKLSLPSNQPYYASISTFD